MSTAFPVDSSNVTMGTGPSIAEAIEAIERAESAAVVACRHCTVPTGDPDGICGFCRDYTPPADVEASPVEVGVGPSPAAVVSAIAAAELAAAIAVAQQRIRRALHAVVVTDPGFWQAVDAAAVIR